MNCDGIVSAADLPELLALVRSGSFGACRGGDVNGDGEVDDLDVPALVSTIFGSRPSDAP